MEAHRGIAVPFMTLDLTLLANPERKLTMQKWEYVTTPLIIHTTTQILNNWGSEGWELVQIVTGPEGGLVAYFKRPVS
jgi:hypothetical protein